MFILGFKGFRIWLAENVEIRKKLSKVTSRCTPEAIVGSEIGGEQSALPPWKELPLPIESEAGWAPEPVWRYWGTEKSFPSARIRTPDRPARSLVTVQTTLLRLRILV
jgi:hypothetical protein